MRISSYVCEATGLKIEGRNPADVDVDGDTEDADLALPVGWAEITVRTIRANPEFETIRERRTLLRSGAIEQRAKQGAPEFTADEMAQIDAELETAVPGSPEIYVEHVAHLCPKQADKLLTTLGFKVNG